MIRFFEMRQPFSIMTQPLSDLGWGPNGSGLAFRIGMGTAATLLIPYMYFVTKSLELLVSKMTKDPDISTAWRLRFSRALRTSYYLSIIAVVCVYMTLIFYDQNGDAFFMHSGCAVIFVTTQTIAIFGYTFVMSLNGRGSVVQMLVACLEIVMALASAAFIIPLFQQYNIIELIKDLFHKTREERIPICIKVRF